MGFITKTTDTGGPLIASGARAVAGPPAVAEPAAGRESPELIAERELEAWDRMPELEMILLPDFETGTKPIDLAAFHYDKVLRRLPTNTYMSRVALAWHGAVGSAGSCERGFRATSFINDLKRRSQKPPAISKLLYLNSNKSMLPSAAALVPIYKQSLVRARQRSDQESNGTHPPDEEVGTDTHIALSFDEMLAGLDPQGLTEWLSFGAARGATDPPPSTASAAAAASDATAPSGAGASGCDVASAIALADDDGNGAGAEAEDIALLAWNPEPHVAIVREGAAAAAAAAGPPS